MVTVYSFKDIAGAFAHPTAGTFTFGGAESNGINQITIHQANENTIHDISVDGGIFILPVLVFNGTITIECQQTSMFHDFLLGWYNQIKSEASRITNPIFTNWANAAMTISKSAVTQTSKHVITGISPQIQADKTYAATAGNVTWSLMAANIVNN